MRTKKSKTKNRNTRNRNTRNRIKGGGTSISNTSLTSVEENMGSNENSHTQIVSQMQEINIHLGQINNAIRACCNSNRIPVANLVENQRSPVISGVEVDNFTNPPGSNQGSNQWSENTPYASGHVLS